MWGNGKRKLRLTPLLETHTIWEWWSNMRIGNGRVTSNVASSKSGGGAPFGLVLPIGVAEVRIRVGTLLGKVTMDVVMVVVSVVKSVMSFVAAVAVTVTEKPPLLMVVSTGTM